jgi:hypothetical protein
MSLAQRVPNLRVLFPCLLVGCASPPPLAREVPTAVLPPPTHATPPGAPSDAALEAKPAAPRRFIVEEQPIPDDIDADTGAAPCDFARTYRGEIGETKVTLLLQAQAGSSGAPLALSGLSHYDKIGPSISLTGSTKSDGTFEVAEKPGGTFTGRCDASSGALRGRFKLGKREEAFELRPRPAAWPGLYRVRRSAMTRPNHPICKKAAHPDVTIEVSTDPVEEFPRAICLPSNPAKRKRILAEAPDLGCIAVDEGYRVFGLATLKIEESVNSALAGGSFEEDVREIQEECTGFRTSHRSMSLITARQDILVVGGFSSQGYGGAHPMNSGLGGMAFDLRDGRELKIGDLVDLPRLRDVAAACLPIYAQSTSTKNAFVLEPLTSAVCGNEGVTARYLWACDKDDLQEPNWALLPDGIVIGGWANAHATAVEDGRGPILPWAVLKREGILKAGAPVAHLWAHVPPAGAGAFACSSSWSGSSLRIWREQPSP